jgi:hypothetical protein
MDIASQRTIFSRNTNVNSGAGTENYFTFFLTAADAYLGVNLDQGTTSYLTSLANTATADKFVNQEWAHAAVTWEWDGTKTVFKLYKNGTLRKTSNTTAATPAQFTEDNKNYLSYVGMEHDSGSGAATNVRLFKGFIYEFALSNYVVVISTLFTNQCVGPVCDICPDTTTCPISACDIDKYPTATGGCGACDGSCSYGCVRQEHCSLCDDRECENCDNFTSTATCASCYATKTAVNAGECKCVNPGE